MDYTELLSTLAQSISLIMEAISKFDISKVDTNALANLATYISPAVQYISVFLDKIIKIYM
ncbi:MAG: hypothetical protein IK063_02660 [Clostridia bacterium]|nr:hypothetical protein [Clostridia bacterium]